MKNLDAVFLFFLALSPHMVGAAELNADSALMDGKSGQITYSGNARLFDLNVGISADEMVTERASNGGIQLARFAGNPARLEHRDPVTGAKTFAQANVIEYYEMEGRIVLRGAAQLQQNEKDGLTRVTADELLISQQVRSIRSLDAKGTPARFERQTGNAAPYVGEAHHLRYRAEGELLTLEGAARLTQDKSTMEHEILLYDGVNRRTTAPKREGSQVRITRQPATPPPSATQQ